MEMNVDLLKSDILYDYLSTNIKKKQILEISLKNIEMINFTVNRTLSEHGKYIFFNVNLQTPNLFEEFNSIHTLNFTVRPIKIVSFDILDCLSSNLTNLCLYGSCKNNENLKIISKLFNLVELDIGANDIRKDFLESNPFDHMIKLENLKLSVNFMKCMNVRCLKNLTKLKSIDLSVNKLEDLPDNLFQFNTKLEVILLEINQIKKINQNQFSSLRELKNLCLAFNRLESIDLSAFKNLNKLESLFLYGNKLTNIDGNLFKDLNTECKIYLECNVEFNRNI